MTSLWRNREFNLLWTSQSLSDLGGAIAMLAVPLLVLESTGSAVQAGAVGTAALVTKVLCRLPAGVLADRVDRRRAMLVCDAVRLLAFLTLAAAVATDRAGLAVIIVVAVLDAICSALFNTVEHASLRSIVPAAQLPAAVARNEARSYGTSLAGPPLGGLLFGLTHALPFLGNALSYLASLVGVALIRKPLQAERDEEHPGHAAALAEGLRFVFGNPFLRAVLAIAAPLNFALSGTIFTIIVTLQQHQVSPGVIGLTETIVGVGGLVGAFAAPTLQRWLPFARLIRFITWAAVGVLGASAMMTTTVLAAVPVALAVFLGPACNAALFGYQAAITPDRLQGRVLSVIFLAAMSVAAAAPLLAGFFVTAWGSPVTVLIFAASVAVAALTASLAAGIRTMRPIEEAAAAQPGR
ncbi:MFS transporter [Paractinoplanes rishiriensis]|uniref:MFS transporter n=1 Tax=Paractinoplanes rishiriensis TaxID=1050105 RepID=A0A919MR77_9ACTN|nr:MFS transporter [Actinoplanes rishiriensis]GIE96921.1 MFS transporter [Actinoplanes rishiriensis]